MGILVCGGFRNRQKNRWSGYGPLDHIWHGHSPRPEPTDEKSGEEVLDKYVEMAQSMGNGGMSSPCHVSLSSLSQTEAEQSLINRTWLQWRYRTADSPL